MKTNIIAASRSITSLRGSWEALARATKQSAGFQRIHSVLKQIASVATHALPHSLAMTVVG